MTGSFPGKLVLSLRQTDFQTLRVMKIGPLPCGGHASSAIPQGHWLHNPLVSSRCVAGAGGAVPARPLIRHGLRPCHQARWAMATGPLPGCALALSAAGGASGTAPQGEGEKQQEAPA